MKAIQIAVIPESPEYNPQLIVLTDTGRIFMTFATPGEGWTRPFREKSFEVELTNGEKAIASKIKED